MYNPWYDDLKNDVVIDLADCKYCDDFHRTLKEAFMFPDYHGRNWSAFWDCLEDFCISHDHDIEIRISSFHKMPQNLQDYAQKIFEILDRAHSLYPNISHILLS